MENTLVIKLTREEALACVLALNKVKRPYKWQQQALAKIDEAMGVPEGAYQGLTLEKSCWNGYCNR